MGYLKVELLDWQNDAAVYGCQQPERLVWEHGGPKFGNTWLPALFMELLLQVSIHLNRLEKNGCRKPLSKFELLSIAIRTEAVRRLRDVFETPAFLQLNHPTRPFVFRKSLM